MDALELAVDDEMFHVVERRQADGTSSYDFTWSSGPDEGTHGFTVGVMVAGWLAAPPDGAGRLSREQLIDEARAFVRAFTEDDEFGRESPPPTAGGPRRQ